MKPIYFVFFLLLMIAGITGFIVLGDPPIGAAGSPHATIPGMSVGGDGAARLVAIGRAPFYFQLCVILLAASLLYMGVAKHRRDRRFFLLVAAATSFAVFVWYKTYSGYEVYLATGQTDVVFGFPVPTNWMLWGVWASFLVFDAIYVVAFRTYYLPHEDEAAFEALVAELKAETDAAANAPPASPPKAPLHAPLHTKPGDA